MSSTTATGGQIPSFGTSFTDSDYGIQGGAGGQVVNAVVDNTGTVLNYSTNAANIDVRHESRNHGGERSQQVGRHTHL